jgi:hypothetical protein
MTSDSGAERKFWQIALADLDRRSGPVQTVSAPPRPPRAGSLPAASLRRVFVLRVPIRLPAVRARGSQEAGCRSRGVEFAPDSPLEERGFELLVPP